MRGQMIANSICQGCPGFSYLAPLMFNYLATRDIGQAPAYASIGDIFDKEELYLVHKVVIETFTNENGNEDDNGMTQWPSLCVCIYR